MCACSVRSHRDYRDDSLDNFNFGDDNEVRREREQHHNGGIHRLGNDRGSGGNFASEYTITNNSNGIGQDKYAGRPRPSGTPITPGASFAVSEAQRLEQKVCAFPRDIAAATGT